MKISKKKTELIRDKYLTTDFSKTETIKFAINDLGLSIGLKEAKDLVEEIMSTDHVLDTISSIKSDNITHLNLIETLRNEVKRAHLALDTESRKNNDLEEEIGKLETNSERQLDKINRLEIDRLKERDKIIMNLVKSACVFEDNCGFNDLGDVLMFFGKSWNENQEY